MKKIIIAADTNPHLLDLHTMLSNAMGGETVKKLVSFSPLSYDGVMKKIHEGKLEIQGMETDMKISKSRFFNCSIDSGKGEQDMIVQISSDKLAIYFN